MKVKSKNPATKNIARERIGILFEQARLAFPEHPAWSNRYVELARKIAMRQRVRIDRELRRQYCHHCYAFLVPGKNMRVRVHSGHCLTRTGDTVALLMRRCDDALHASRRSHLQAA